MNIYYGSDTSGYGRIRFYQNGTNNQTIHCFSTSWQSGTISSASSGCININGVNGVTFGGWNAVDGYVATGGAAWFRGDVTAYSDARVKENVMVVENALDKINSIRGVTFIRTDKNDGKRYAGVIAQEILQILPEVVTQNEEGMYSVAYGNMASLFIEAIKELNQKVEDQQKIIDSLLNKSE